jgi:hypothetical protein
MADQDLEAIDSTVQGTHECLGTMGDTSQLGKDRHAVLEAGHVLMNIAIAVIPGLIIVALSVVVLAAFGVGYLAALR